MFDFLTVSWVEDQPLEVSSPTDQLHVVDGKLTHTAFFFSTEAPAFFAVS